jgi:hypothetical protein
MIVEIVKKMLKAESSLGLLNLQKSSFVVI